MKKDISFPPLLSQQTSTKRWSSFLEVWTASQATKLLWLGGSTRCQSQREPSFNGWYDLVKNGGLTQNSNAITLIENKMMDDSAFLGEGYAGSDILCVNAFDVRTERQDKVELWGVKCAAKFGYFSNWSVAP